MIGLGYVGLPLGVEFSKHYKTYGFDINENRISELKSNHDITNEKTEEELGASKLIYTSSPNDIKKCNIFIVTVPTPINKHKQPDLGPLKSANLLLGKILKKGDLVIYESTVYPGCTEEFCVPILEEESNLIYNKDFYCGYSPERINPGDKTNTLVNITKVTSGSNPKISKFVDKLYSKIVNAGTYLASSIQVAEAAKAIENAQRDVNISFVNELSLIFDRLNLDTNEVLDAASTKWNFLPFRPGLVGGHCISVDPYYLAYKAESSGYSPEIILSGRRINDSMPDFIAAKMHKMLVEKNPNDSPYKILILGISFKENCPDIRNTKVVEIYTNLIEHGILVDIFDPIANSNQVKNEYDINLLESIDDEDYDGIIIAVPHKEFMNEFFLKLFNKKKLIVYDLKAMLDKHKSHARL